MPVDIGGMITVVLLYAAGFIALGIALLINGNKAIALIFLLYIGAPIVSVIYLKTEQSAQLREQKKNEEINLKAFGQYCKGQKQIVHSKAPQQEGGVSLLVRIEKSFHGVNWKFNAYPIFEYLSKNPDLCARTGVKTLEGFYHGAYSAERKGYENEVRRYVMCSNEKWEVVPEALSRFELIIGQAGSKDLAPYSPNASRWMATSSVQIVDRFTGKVMAEDTMYFLNYDSGEGGCPEGMSQLSSLLTAVFGHQ